MPTMAGRSGSLSYDQDDAETHVTTESERLRSHLREKCNQTLDRLFPDSGRDDVADWNKEDVMCLHAIFELARVARHAETTNPLLPRHTILRVLTKLATFTPFQDISPSSLIELEQHLRLLAVALRLYKYEGTSLSHKLRDDLYQGITKLSEKFRDDRRDCGPTLHIEKWNVAFLLQHCQYILLSIEDSYSLAKTAASKVLKLIDGTLSAYGGQYVDARRYGRDALRRQRTRPKWHESFMELEDLCFAIYARGVGVEIEFASSRDEAELHSEELGAATKLRDNLDDQLFDESRNHPSLTKAWNGLVGRTTQITFESGPYEENGEYFKYGILDLMYELSFRVKNRAACFEQFVGVLKSGLENSHRSSNPTNRKIIDIYQRIRTLGDDNGVIYGKIEERAAIEAWMRRNSNQFEPYDAAKARAQRISGEISKIRSTEKLLLSGSFSALDRTTTRHSLADFRARHRPITQSTLQSEYFPNLPEAEPRSNTRDTIRATPTTISIASEPLFTSEPLRQSPEPAISPGRLPNSSSSNIDEDDDLMMIMDHFRRNPSLRRQVHEYIENTPSEFTAMPVESVSHASTIRPAETPSAQQRRSSRDSYQSSHQDGPLASHNSTPRTTTARPRGESIPSANGTQTSWVQLEPTVHQPTRPVNGDLIDLSDDHHPPVAPVQSNPHTNPPSIQISIPTRNSNFTRTTAERSPGSSLPTDSNNSRPSISETLTPQFSGSYAQYADIRPYALLHGQEAAPRPRSIEFTAMSSTAKTVAIFTKSKFWVFDTRRLELLMRGVCDKRSPYKFAAGAAKLDLQRPPTDKFETSSFSCVAVSDEYLAISAKDKVMVFATRGVHAGRLLVCDHIPKAGITKLSFSNDGTQLVGLVVVDDRISYEEARIYSTDTFGPRPNGNRPDVLNTNDISLARLRWDRDFVHSPSGLAFSKDGNMVAICTTHSKAQAQIRILKREVATWRNWGIKEVTVHTADHREWHGLALTGISFFQNDKCLALAVDSTNPDAADCYHIVSERTHFRLERSQQIASGPRGTCNLAIAVSQRYDAVALLNRDGMIQIKPDGQLLGTLHKHTHIRLNDPIAMGFDERGMKLMIVDHHGTLWVHSFRPDKLGPEKMPPIVPILDLQH